MQSVLHTLNKHFKSKPHNYVMKYEIKVIKTFMAFVKKCILNQTPTGSNPGYKLGESHCLFINYKLKFVILNQTPTAGKVVIYLSYV